MDCLRLWIGQDIALVRSKALKFCNYITARAINAVPLLKANFKLYAYEQPLPTTTRGSDSGKCSEADHCSCDCDIRAMFFCILKYGLLWEKDVGERWGSGQNLVFSR
jgi:hypothetical protein